MFPSPYGDYGSYLYINIRRMLGIAKSSGFRPLAGIMVLIQTVLIDGLIAGRLVSVPLRGLWFLSRLNFLTNLKKFKFPSPYGDYGSYHLSLSFLMAFRHLVSVPLRGLWFLSGAVETYLITWDDKVSVPLRGLWFLSAPFINGFMKPLK